MAIQGVNIGGWLIPENWLTPTLFAGTQVKDLDGLLETELGRQRYESHVNTFITEEDFKWLEDNEVKLIRLPIGYWTFEANGHYPVLVEKLDWAMAMAEKYNLHVLIDLHAAKGSQNGHVHSAKIGKIEWYRYRENRDQTLKTLIAIAKRYGKSSSLWGIELLNEPKMGHHYFSLLLFYRRAYRELRKVLRPGVYTVFHDAFHPILFTGALLARKDYPVLFDAHWYVIAPSISGKLSFYRYQQLQRLVFGSLLWLLQRQQPVMVGEWSSVLPQEIFNRTPQQLHPELLRETIVTQQAIYSTAFATTYWTYKAEGRGMWNFRSLVEDGLLVIK